MMRPGAAAVIEHRGSWLLALRLLLWLLVLSLLLAPQGLCVVPLAAAAAVVAPDLPDVPSPPSLLGDAAVAGTTAAAGGRS